VAGRLLPDTNAFIALLKGDAGVAALLDDASEVLLSAIVLGELTYGALNSRRVEDNLGRLRDLHARCVFVPVEEGVVRQYGATRIALKRKGQPIPENDLWIAATAIHSGATLLTDDEHFDVVEGLTLERIPKG
jgi:tRNA(fMet)-specific endonuclease VapC